MPDVRPSIAENLSKTFNRIRARGLGEAWDLVFSRTRDTLWSDDSLVVFSAPSGGDPDDRTDLRLELATAADARRFADDIGTDSPSTFEARLSAESLCFLVHGDDRILHSSWVALHAAWTRELRGYVMPPTGDAYVYESFTRADARGRGVYPYALRGIRLALHTRGVNHIWVAAEADNEPSVRAITKAGFEERYRLSYRRRAGWFHLDDGAPEGTGLDVVRRLPPR